jgi:hypothetical protein
MHVKKIIHKNLKEIMHLKRLNALTSIVTGAFEAKALSVTGLGRALDLPIQERSGIRKVDRLIGNQKLYQERVVVYGVFAQQLIGNKKRPWLIVDWSPIPNTTHQLLRAAVVCEGRALSIYEEVHEEKYLANRKVHKAFLRTLKSQLPPECCPIIVTDAGYHATWFKLVLQVGWDYVGRVRGLVKYQLKGEREWHKVSSLHPQSNRHGRKIGTILLSKTERLEGQLCCYKGVSKGRVSKNKLGKRRQATDSKNHAKSAKEAWLLMTSLDGHYLAKTVVKIYKTRMQIEEGFRDLKSSQYGFGFERAYSRQIKRIELLLLIAMLASYVAWIVGWNAERQNLHYQFQANTIKNRRVLSLFYVGCRIMKKKIMVTLEPISNIADELEWADDCI